MIDCDFVDHGNETTFKPGVVKIEPCNCTGFCDLNQDGGINPVDVVCIVNCVYKSKCDCIDPIAGCPGMNGDWDCNGRINPVDVVYYVQCVYKGRCIGPCNPCACDSYPTNCPAGP